MANGHTIPAGVVPTDRRLVSIEHCRTNQSELHIGCIATFGVEADSTLERSYGVSTSSELELSVLAFWTLNTGQEIAIDEDRRSIPGTDVWFSPIDRDLIIRGSNRSCAVQVRWEHRDRAFTRGLIGDVIGECLNGVDRVADSNLLGVLGRLSIDRSDERAVCVDGHPIPQLIVPADDRVVTGTAGRAIEGG